MRDKIKGLDGRHLKLGGSRTLCKLNIARKKLELHEREKIQQNRRLQWKLNKKYLPGL